MKILVEEVSTGEFHECQISECDLSEMPLRKDGWQFTWRKLAKIEGAQFYKLTLKQTPQILEGVLMITLLNEEMIYMNNVEVAPHNYGRAGKYEGVAGSLIAFASLKSFEQGKGPYVGYLSFDSKTELIELYEQGYGATWAMGQKMFIDPGSGKSLMKRYLNIEL
jgi:hypothetical protein